MVQQLNSDEDYLAAGVEPPEHIPHQGSDQVQFDRHVHEWSYNGGPWLHCERGNHPHGKPFDHLNHILIGTDRHGEPILKKLDLSDKKADDGRNGVARAKRTRAVKKKKVKRGRRQNG